MSLTKINVNTGLSIMNVSKFAFSVKVWFCPLSSQKKPDFFCLLLSTLAISIHNEKSQVWQMKTIKMLAKPSFYRNL